MQWQRPLLPLVGTMLTRGYVTSPLQIKTFALGQITFNCCSIFLLSFAPKPRSSIFIWLMTECKFIFQAITTLYICQYETYLLYSLLLTPMNKPQQKLIGRPPVVVVMGHIDHGKSTLLDYIRKSNIVAGEAGGITQHMGAYQVEHISSDGKKHPITFIDTPGHAAFCTIRERGAQVADVAILVVSAEDGVMPQTMEAYSEIKKAKIPYVVAITKMDKPNADENKAKQTLGEHEIYVEGWGGDIPCVSISAIKGTNVNELLDMILLVVEMADLKTDASAKATGAVIESSLDTKKGISATLVIKDGTIEVGQFVVSGIAFAPIRYIEDFKGVKIQSATASVPIRIVGWSEMPECGNDFTIVESKKEAEKITQEEGRKQKGESNTQKQVSPLSASDTGENQIAIIPLVVKADFIGSLDGVKFELNKITHDRVKLKIVNEGIGDINENDVKLAYGNKNMIVIGFNVGIEKKSEELIQRSPFPLNVKTFKIIYELKQFVEEILTAKIPKEYVEESMGLAKILAIFSKEKDKQVVGGKVATGVIELGNEVKIIRREAEIGRGKVRELQQAKKKAQEVREGFEFGTMIEAKMEIVVGDRIEAVRTIEKTK